MSPARRPPRGGPSRPLVGRLAGFFALCTVLSFFSLPGWVTLVLLGAAAVVGAVAVWNALLK